MAPTWVIGKATSDTLVGADCHLRMNVCCQDGETVQAQYLEGQELAGSTHLAVKPSILFQQRQ